MLSKAVFWSLLLILPVQSNHISGTVNTNRFLQRELPVEDVSACIKKCKVLSLKDTYKNVLECYQSGIINCLCRKLLDDKTFTRFDKPVYCGAIITTGINQITTGERKLHIQVMQEFIINTDFQIFDFHWHPGFLAHGLAFSESARKTPPFYRGRRLPWRIFVPDNRATIFISTLPHMPYFVRLYYVRYKLKWLINTSFVDDVLIELNTHYVDFSTLSSLRKVSEYDVNIASIKYYVIGGALGKLKIYFSSERKSNTHITLHDGPGDKSQSILSFDCMMTCNEGIQTSTFIAYIIIENVMHENAGRVVVRIYQGDLNYRDCTVRNHVIEEVSSSQTNTICLVRWLVLYDTLKLKVDYFEFIGPTAVAPDAVELCQYGGFFFFFNASRVSICENMYEQTLYAGDERSMFGWLVWFKGYSSGFFRGRIVETECITHYIGFTSDDVETTEIDDSMPCQTYICSPTASREGRECHFKLRGQSGRPIGNAIIYIAILKSLFVCFPSSDNTGSLKYNMTTWANPKWPLGEIQKDKTSNVFDRVDKLTYLYLIRSSIFMPILCNSTNYQVAVRLETGMCRFISAINTHVDHRAANDIQMMSSVCYGLSYIITPSVSHQIYYVEDNTTNYPATIIDTHYRGSCQKCNFNFTYVVYILNNKENIVVEHEADVGQAIFTGFQFHGIRMDIIGPKKPYSWGRDCADCEVAVLFHKVDEEVGVALPHTWTLNSVTYSFHTRR